MSEVTHPQHEMSASLRAMAQVLRRSSMPLSDLIPQIQKTADELDRLSGLIDKNWWRMMDSAPLDGTEVLLLIPNQGGAVPGYHQVVGLYRDHDWHCGFLAVCESFPSETYTPIAWKPVTEPTPEELGRL